MAMNQSTVFTRRDMLRGSLAIAGGALAAQLYPATLVRAATPGFPQEKSAADRVAAMRAQFGGVPIQSQPLTDTLTLLSGPGGNIIVLNGADGLKCSGVLSDGNQRWECSGGPQIVSPA